MTILPINRPRMLRSRANPRSREEDVVARLHGRSTANLRPLRAGESGPLLEVFAGMSEQSRADRYLAGATRLPSAMLAALVDVDGYDHVAWLATVAGRPAGIARYVRLGPATAEIAFEVVDALHGRGIGTVLVDAVTTVAAAQGISRLQATVVPTNKASLRMVRRLGVSPTLVDGLYEGEGPLRLLDPARVDRAAVLALAAASRQASAETTWTSPVASAH